MTLIYVNNLFSQDLSMHKWKNRLVIVITNNIENSLFKEQLEELKKDSAGLNERKLVVYQVKNMEYLEGLEIDGKWERIETEGMLNLKKESNSNFEIILIGLDGWVKLRQSKMLMTAELFSIIDAMPMRMQEIENLNREK